VIVGVGGSAGSLTPLRELFAALPAESGLAFVVVSHQSPTGKSLLPEILAKTTEMPVSEIGGETKALPDHVYVVPRGHVATVHDAVLAIDPIGEPSRVPLPIDSFFRSLARDRGHGAVGIVLSGTGSDGTLGLAAIRAESGLCLAQDPETAEFDGMPASAIAAQATDFVLPVGEMPARLIAYARSVRAPRHGGEPAGISSGEMERILTLIRMRGGHDFSAYKRETLLRRVERRMDLHRIERLTDYARYLEENDEEIDALWRDWLIGVSGFFRDPEAFQALAESGLPLLLAAGPGIARSASGCRAARREKRPTRSPSWCTRRWRPAASTSTSRSSRRTSTPPRSRPPARDAIRRRSQGRSGHGVWSVSSSRRSTAIESGRSCGTASCSPCRTSCTIRRSRGWTWSPAGTSSSTWFRAHSRVSCPSSTTA
jgi:hypothetical protein